MQIPIFMIDILKDLNQAFKIYSFGIYIDLDLWMQLLKFGYVGKFNSFA